MSLHDPVISCKSRGSYGAHVLDHLAADGAGFAGGQVAVIAVLQVDADLPWCSFSSYFLPGSGLDGSGKLLFPNVQSEIDVDKTEFRDYCLIPAMKMRRIIKLQQGFIDTEYKGKDVPFFTVDD